MNQTLYIQQEKPSYSWSASATADKSREKRASYTPLEKMEDYPIVHDEKTIVTPATLVSQMQTMLIVDDDEIFDDENGEEEEDFTYLPSTSNLNRRESDSSEFSHIQYINSVRKARPLPKIPERNSSKELPQNMTEVFTDNFRNQNKLTAQQLFQMMMNQSRASALEDSDEEEQEEEEEYGGVYALKTQISSPALSKNNLIKNSPYHYENFNTNYYKMMTPVEEVEEEDQLYAAYEEEIAEEDDEEEETSPTFMLEPVEPTRDNLRPLSQVSLTAPSLTSGRTSPSSHSSRRSMESTRQNDNRENDTEPEIYYNEQEDRNNIQPQHIEQYTSQQYYQQPVSQPQQQQQQQPYDTVNGISSLYASDYGYQQESQYYETDQGYGQQPQQHNNTSEFGESSLLSDVKRLSQLNQALMTPVISNNNISPADQIETPTPQQQQQQQRPHMAKMMSSFSNDYSNINTTSPLAMTSFSLTHDKESIKIYRRMATKTHDRNIQFTYAKYLMQLVSFYATEKNNTRDRLQEEAEYWIEKLAKSNYAEALYIKGQWHRHCCDKNAVGVFVGSQYKKVNHSRAFKCFQQAAKFGSTEAHYELAEYWKERKEYKKALSSYRYAASKNHILSLYKLANIMLRGLLHQEKDVRQGLIFLKKAADSNKPESASSAYDLACIYSNDLESIDLDRNTIITPSISNQTFGLAVQYYKKADELGLVAATFRLGYIFEHGHLNTEANVWDAYRYYAKAAEKKHEDAMLELSRLYKEGISGYLNPHPQMAYKWCLSATENGNEVAEYMLGIYYEFGVGVYPDYSQALEWFSKSASKGYGPAEDKLNVPSNKRVSMISRGLEDKVNRQRSNKSPKKKYYEESVRIAEKSRRTHAEQNCQIM